MVGYLPLTIRRPLRPAGRRMSHLIIILASLFLSGCVSNVWTGANLLYDRHHVYIKINDFQLNASANRVLYKDMLFKQDGIDIEMAVLNRDVLLTGYVPTMELRQEAYERVEAVTTGRRRLFTQISVRTPARGEKAQDLWITTKIRSQIVADADINPSAFKVVTSGGVVYLMGDVIPEQAEKVILFSRKCAGVKRVVKLFKYYNLSDSPI